MLISILIFAVLAILLIFFLIKSAETWNWIPITFVALIFITTIFAGYVASQAIEARRAWAGIHKSNLKKLDEAKASYAEALFGAADLVDGYGEGSLRQVDSQLRLDRLGQGRIWEGGLPELVDGNFLLSFNIVEGQVAPTTQISRNMILQVFAAGGAEGFTVPANYVGELKVEEVNEGDITITLSPIFLTKFFRTGDLMRRLANELSRNELDVLEVARLRNELFVDLSEELRLELEGVGQDPATQAAWLLDNSRAFNPNSAWSLFEKMPADSRNVFKEHMGFEPFSVENPATVELLTEYRNALQNTYLPAELVGLEPDSEDYEQLLDEYTFDGVAKNVIEEFIRQNAGTRIKDRFELIEDEQRVVGLLRINGSQSEEFVVDGSGQVSQEGSFDQRGGANDPNLKHGGSIRFAQGDEVFVPKGPAVNGIPITKDESGPALIDSSDAEWLDVDYFQRELRNYPFSLRESRNLTTSLTEQLNEVRVRLQATKDIQQKTSDQLSFRDLKETKLRQDIASMDLAKQEADRLVALREGQLEQTQRQVQIIYNQIVEMYKQVDQESEFLDTKVEGETVPMARRRP